MEPKTHCGLSSETLNYINEQIAKRLKVMPKAPSPKPLTSIPRTRRRRKHALNTYESEIHRLRLPRDGSGDLQSLDLRQEIRETAVKIAASRKQVSKLRSSRATAAIQKIFR